MGEITDFEPIEKVESDIICLFFFFQSEFHAFANKGDELQIRQRGRSRICKAMNNNSRLNGLTYRKFGLILKGGLIFM